MKKSALLATIALVLRLLDVRAAAAEAPPTEVVFIDHAQMENGFSKGMVLLANSSYRIQAGRRVTTGQAEVHASETDIFL